LVAVAGISMKNRHVKQQHLVFGIFFIWFVIALCIIPISALQFYIVLMPSVAYFCALAITTIGYKYEFTALVVTFSIILTNDVLFKRYSTYYREKQDHLIRDITLNTSPEAIAFVGNPNYAIYRPSIGYYHFIHRGIWMTMPTKEKNKIRNSFGDDNKAPHIISYDYNIRTFFPELKEKIQENYKAVPGTLRSKGRIYEYELFYSKE
jgi:hypothetical protein